MRSNPTQCLPELKANDGVTQGSLDTVFQFKLLNRLVLFCLLIPASLASATVLHVADYLPGAETGLTNEYQILDTSGKEIGVIREEVVADPAGSAPIIHGESAFYPPQTPLHTAEFTNRIEFSSAGEWQPAGFEASTRLNSGVLATVSAEFEKPTENFASISTGETRRMQVRFSRQETVSGSSTVIRAGTMTTTWTLAGFEEVLVPAGLFAAAKVTIETEVVYDNDPANPERSKETTWLAPGVGSVKRLFEAHAEGSPATHQLAFYELPTDPDDEDSETGPDPVNPDPNEPDPEQPDPRQPDPGHFASQDIGATGHAGSVEWADDGETILVRGSGRDLWFEEDGFHFLHRELKGDGEIIVRYLDQDRTHTHAKAGVMIRESLSPDARHAALTMSPLNTVNFLWREVTKSRTYAHSIADRNVPIWLRLQRDGAQLTGSISSDRVNWETVGSVILLNLPDSLFVGLAVTAKNNRELNEARFDSLSFHGADWTSGDPDSTPGASGLTARNIGSMNHTGTTEYNKADNAFTLSASGTGIWSRADGFHFLHQELKGDGKIVARVTGFSGAGNWAKAGLMIRETLDADSRHAMIVNTPFQSISLQRRKEAGDFTFDTTLWGTRSPVWLKLERVGRWIDASYSEDGNSWMHFESIEMPFAESVHVGLVYSSGENALRGSASFDSVTYPDGQVNGSSISVEPAMPAHSPLDDEINSSPSTVSFASTGSSLNPVGTNRFALFLNRDGNTSLPADVRFELIGPGAELLRSGMMPATNSIDADSDFGILFFELSETAYIPHDMPFMVQLVDGYGYRVGSADSVLFTIHARPLDTWKAEHFTTSEQHDPTISGDRAAPAGDAVPNLLKYALGLDPNRPAVPGDMPNLILADGNPALSFGRPSGRTDVRYIVEVSNDLKTWQSGAGEVEITISNLGSTEHVIARDRIPYGSERQRFMRLRVERR